MDCERFDKISLELLYDELDELSAASARRHLHHCTRCQGLWNKMRATRELCQVPMEDPPAGMFENIIDAAENEQRALPMRAKVSRAVSILADYAMRPQLAMAALLLLMIGSSLVFVRTEPEERDKVRVTELGTPYSDKKGQTRKEEPLVYEAESGAAAAPEDGKPKRNQAAVDEKSTEQESPSEDDAGAYTTAMAAYQEGRYAEAERLFSEVAAAGGEKAASAALHEGHSARNGSGCQRAAALYDAVAARYPGSTVAHEALWHAASCYRTMGQTERARAHYELLAKKPAYAERARAALESLPPPDEETTSPAVAARARAAPKPAAKPQPSSDESESGTPTDEAAASAPAPAPSPRPAAKPKADSEAETGSPSDD